MCRLREDPAAARHPQAADAGRAGAGRDRGVRRADGVHRRRGAAHAPADRRAGRRADQAEDIRVPVHERAAHPQEAGQVHAVALLRLGGAHRRAARAARRVGVQGGCVRRGGRGDQGMQAARLPGHHQHHVLQHRHPADRHRRARLPQRRPGRGRDDDLPGLRLREGARPGALPGRDRDEGTVPQGVRERQPQALAAQPLAVVPRLPRGQGRLRLHRVGDPLLFASWLAAALLPDVRRLHQDLRRADRDDGLGGLRTGQGPALRELHGALRLRAVGGARDHGIAAGVAARHAGRLTLVAFVTNRGDLCLPRAAAVPHVGRGRPRGVRTFVTASAGNPVTVHGPDPAAAGARRARLAGGAAWMPLIPALVTLAVALYQIQRPSLWRDEGATLAAVHRSLPQLLRMLGHTDVVHGAYYVLMWFETRAFGTSVLALRFPSAVGMAVAAGFLAALGRRLVSTRAGLAAGLVFAVLPGVTWYAQNARSYALVTALATIASYLLVRAMAADPGRRWRWLTGYGVSLAVMGLGNIFALLL